MPSIQKLLRHSQRVLLGASAALSARDVSAQQDGLIAFPNVYKVQFENRWVRLIRVRLPGHAQLAEHTHPAGLMLHVYFNDADPVQFNHDGPPNDVTRPPVKARSYRVGRATPEVHSVVNMGTGLSDYMRVELKTQGSESQRSRVPTPALENKSSSVVEVNTSQYRSTRVTIAAGDSLEISTTTAAPALLLALTEGANVSGGSTLAVGEQHFVETGARVIIRNRSGAPAQLLRVDLLTPPM